MKISTTIICLLFGAFLALDLEAQDTNRLTDADRLQIEVQKICPVTGAELGSMGEPVKVQIGDQNAYLCCKGCVDKQVQAEHWATIQANFAKAQGTCPIMGKPITAESEFTVVKGQKIFICCPPCTDKIKANVEDSLKKVNASYVSFVNAEKSAESDRLHAAAQAICPVSGQKLGSMGDPIKVKVGDDEHAFLCCKGCIGKQINAEHWKTIQTNLAKAQGTCPVMGKKVDSSMESATVNGRKIFVCCPPCIAKINADPNTYIAKLDAQIKANTAGTRDDQDHSAQVRK